jgi:hypothetical protein
LTILEVARWANKVFKRYISCSNHNKKFGLRRPNGRTRFTNDIPPKWMFCGRHEDLTQKMILRPKDPAILE